MPPKLNVAVEMSLRKIVTKLTTTVNNDIIYILFYFNKQSFSLENQHTKGGW